jgi:hypothetical protein
MKEKLVDGEQLAQFYYVITVHVCIISIQTRARHIEEGDARSSTPPLASPIETRS